MNSGLRAGILALTLVLAAVASPKAVTFGEPDGNRHPYVGTLVLKTATGYYSCSGTLLSASVVVTAGHCTEEAGVANLRTWVSFAPVISLAGLQNYPTIDAFFDDPRNGWVSGTAIAHPQYNDFATFPAIYDVGVVILSRRVRMSTYGRLPAENFLTTITPTTDRFTVVGYGLQGYIKPRYSDIWERYQGQLKLIELNSTFNAGMTAKFTNNPGTGGGTCYGDSGGPIFYDATNIVVAVVSWGKTPCIGNDYNFRLDTDLALSFVRQYL